MRKHDLSTLAKFITVNQRCGEIEIIKGERCPWIYHGQKVKARARCAQHDVVSDMGLHKLERLPNSTWLLTADH